MKKYGLAAAAMLTSSIALATDRLNVKTGLWEVTVIAQTSGIPELPAAVLEKIPAEQREQMASLLGNKPTTHKSQECVTEKDLDQPFQAEEIKHCKVTPTKTSPTVQEFDIVCGGEAPSRGKMHVEAPTPETMTGWFDMSVDKPVVGSETLQIRTRLAGQWLGAACKKEAE